MKNGRCRLHGGKSTGPKQPAKLIGNQNAIGNKSALTTGEFETITWETLTDDEREWYREQYDLGPNQTVDSLLEMEFVRQARMVQRMDKLDESLYLNFDEIIRLEYALNRVVGKVGRMVKAIEFRKVCRN
jgi:uncharacterized protein YjcR